MSSNADQEQPPRCPLLLSKQEVAELLGTSEKTVQRLETSDPDFPKPVKIRGCKRWRRDKILDYVDKL